MKTQQTPSLTVSHIFDKYIAEYLNTYRVSYEQRKAINDILRCHRAECGKHSRVCIDCGNIDFLYNSCRNRHCPNCQNAQKQKWILQRKKELLPVRYFHLVFTVPHQLNPVFLFNKELSYQLMFENVWKTIQYFSSNPKWLGAQTGCIALLHTWGQNMSFHPHIHCIMPAGGLTEDGFEWLQTHQKYFAPVKEMSQKFKIEFLKSISYKKEELKLSSGIKELEILLEELEKINWVVFAQPTFVNSDYVIDYLGNYTHKIAISNYRLIKIENDFVFFYWKDYKDQGKTKIIRLPAFEFIHRFLEHVLPRNFYKIRYFGIYANRFKASNIQNAIICLEREGKKISNSKLMTEIQADLPYGCPYMGLCKECGGVTISLYHYHIKMTEQKITHLQTG
jgi:hypothetical protein